MSGPITYASVLLAGLCCCQAAARHPAAESPARPCCGTDSSCLLQTSVLNASVKTRTGAVPSKVLDSSTGAQIPLVAMGTWPASFDGGTSSDQVTEALTTWISLGGRHIDTADVYGNQGDVGRAIEKVKGTVGRDQLFITSKVPGPVGYDRAKSLVVSDMLPKLKTDHVDLLLMHWPCTRNRFNQCDGQDGLSERVATWRALEELRAEGKVRNLGVSNFEIHHLEAFFEAVRRDLGGPANLTANQVRWNLDHHDDALLAWCTEHRVTLESYSPLGGRGGVAAQLRKPAVASIAEARKVKPAQVIFRWVVQRGIVLVSGSTDPGHMAEDLDPLFALELTEAEMSSLDGP